MQTGTAAGPTNEVGSALGDSSSVQWESFTGGSEGIERVTELQWPNSIKVYNSMPNDAQVSSLLYGLLLPIRAYRWYIDPNNAGPDAVARISADYNLPIGLEGEFHRRRAQKRFSFDKHMEDALRALQYGHYFFEQEGEVREDGAWHLRKLGIRPPRTLTEINVANDGGLKNIVQGYNGLNKIEIDIGRLVAYIWDREGANWTGRSMLRSVYRNYIVKDRVLRVGAVNIERAGGVPYVQAPEGASAPQIRELDLLARNFRVGEGAGAALPHGAQLKFATAANGDGAVAYIKQQNEEMARAFLQMVSMLGQTNSGSRALGGTFHEILQIAQFTIAKWFADIFNEHVIEDDIEWNEGPEEEYAPLLKFDAGGQDPMEGFDEKLDEDADDPEGSGLKIENKETLKALGRYETRRRVGRSPRRPGPKSGGAVTGSTTASEILLPPRPLRRKPYDHEIQAQVDFAAIDSTHAASLTYLRNEIRIARTFQIDELRDAIADANGSLSKIAKIKTDVSVTEAIRSNLEAAASFAIDQAIQEAQRQGVNVPRQPVSDLHAQLTDRAEAIDQILQNDITASAVRQATRLTGGSLSPQEVAEETHRFLIGLAGAYAEDILSGAVQQSINAGRKLVFQRDGADGTIYASEILDTNTCGHCIEIDGTEYESVVDAERDYPTGGYKDCDGRERCRGTIVKRYSEVREEVPA